MPLTETVGNGAVLPSQPAGAAGKGADDDMEMHCKSGSPAAATHPGFGPLHGCPGKDSFSFLTSHPKALITFPLCRPLLS